MKMGLQDEERKKWSCEKVQSNTGGKGFQQVHGIDYDETFAPVEKMDSIQLDLTIVVERRWEVHQMDVNNSFLHGYLKEYIYMEQPQGYVQDSSLVFDSKSHSTTSSRCLECGMIRWILTYFLKILFIVNQIPMFICLKILTLC
jgi:hypothetical protein